MRTLGTIIKMRHTLIYIGLIILLSTCGQKSELIKNSWVIVDGNYMGQPIEFHITDLLKFSDRNGSEIKSFNFSKDGTVGLPGINSPNISAKWTVADGQIIFSVDSTRYSIYNTIDSDLSFLDTSDSIQSKKKSEPKQKIINPLATKELKKAMEIYGQRFNFYISRDTLMLVGQKGEIRAVRDRTVDDLFRNL